MPPSPALKAALDESTATWKKDLENLLNDAKSRFGDIVWHVLDDNDPDERVGGVWGAKTPSRKRNLTLRTILEFTRDPNANTPERYREVWGHKAMIYSRASAGFHLQHLSQRIGMNLHQQANVGPSNKENTSATKSRLSTPFRYTVFVHELLDIYAGKGGLGDFENLRIDCDPDSDEDRRTKKLRQDLLVMSYTKFYSDTRIIISDPNDPQDSDEKDVRHAHAFMLVSRSPYFEAIFSGQEPPLPELPVMLTLPRSCFTPASLQPILEYIYTGTLPASFFDTAEVPAVCDVWRGAIFLGIPTLQKLMKRHIITMLHGLCFSDLDNVEYKRLLGGSWTRMVASGGCQCASCRQWLPHVFAFSMDPDTQNTQLERGALRGLLKLFGLGWCTSYFAELSPKSKNYVMLIFRITVLNPSNALSLLFVAEETLSKLDGLDAPGLEPIRRMILSARDSIDIILREKTSACLDSDEWETIRKNDVLDVDLGIRSATNPKKLAIIGRSILRGVGPQGMLVSVYQAINVYTKETSRRGVHTPTNSVLQAHLHHLKGELRKLMHDPPDDLEDSAPSDSVRSSIQTSSADASTSISARPTSAPYSSYSTLSNSGRPTSSAETLDAARQSSSIDALDLASISSYSHASSRTESTDYGLYYTRRAFLDSDSIDAATICSNREPMPGWRESMRSLMLGSEGEVAFIAFSCAIHCCVNVVEQFFDLKPSDLSATPELNKSDSSRYHIRLEAKIDFPFSVAELAYFLMTTLESSTPLFEAESNAMSEKPLEGIVKCLVIGDGGVGKTTLITKYCTGNLVSLEIYRTPTRWAAGVQPVTLISHLLGQPPDYLTLDLYTEALDPAPHMIEGFEFKLVIFDTGGAEDYDRLRPLSYPMTDIFLMCFSLNDPASFQRVRNHYAPEVSSLNPTTPVLLVGMKVDLRNTSRHAPFKKSKPDPITISRREGLDLFHEIKATAYMECSAFTNVNVTEVFDLAMRLALSPTFKTSTSKKRRWNRSCIIA